jgi:hypothetical protein
MRDRFCKVQRLTLGLFGARLDLPSGGARREQGAGTMYIDDWLVL